METKNNNKEETSMDVFMRSTYVINSSQLKTLNLHLFFLVWFRLTGRGTNQKNTYKRKNRIKDDNILQSNIMKTLGNR